MQKSGVQGGCRYWKWPDPEMCARSKQIIPYQEIVRNLEEEHINFQNFQGQVQPEIVEEETVRNHENDESLSNVIDDLSAGIVELWKQQEDDDKLFVDNARLKCELKSMKVKMAWMTFVMALDVVLFLAYVLGLK